MAATDSPALWFRFHPKAKTRALVSGGLAAAVEQTILARFLLEAARLVASPVVEFRRVQTCNGSSRRNTPPNHWKKLQPPEWWRYNGFAFFGALFQGEPEFLPRQARQRFAATPRWTEDESAEVTVGPPAFMRGGSSLTGGFEMSRLPIALCISTSLLALGVAGLALLEVKSRAPESPLTQSQDVHDLRRLVDSLHQKVGELEARDDELEELEELEQRVGGFRAATTNPEAPASGPAADLPERVAAHTERLARLESEETIARLAHSGEAQIIEKDMRSALDQVGNPDVSPQARLEALRSLRRLSKTHRSLMESVMEEGDLREQDIVLPMLELVRDTTLDSDLRADVVRHLVGSKVEELRQPMLDLLAFDEIPTVREGALEALMYHLGDSAIREAITRVSREDRHEAVQARATRYLPKVQYFDRLAAEATDGTASGGEK